VDELIKYTKIGQQSVRLQPIDVGELIQRVRGQMLTEDGALARIEWAIENMPVVWGDPALLHQALTSLLHNAVKFSQQSADPKIEIFTLQPEPGIAAISIRDNGVGFDMRYRHKLFNVFQRLHSEQEFPGIGIGLAIVRRAIERQNGAVWAESNPGNGATFSFSLKQAGT
jgi:two-component system, chemotaxis family, sensor kinase Cph1